MRIRPAKLRDLDPLMGITLRCIKHLDSLKIYQWDEIYPSEKDFKSDILDGNLFIVAPPHEEIIRGCICINDREYPGYEDAYWDRSEFVVIHKILIEPLYEDLGFGRYAMTFAEKVACSHKKDSIRLDCYRKNIKANRFYQKLGYTLKGVTLFRKGIFNLYEKLL